MGKIAPSWKCSSGYSDESSERVRKKKRKKDLEEIRRNALAAKRTNQFKDHTKVSQKTQTSLMKTLNSFASKRQEIENITKTQNLLLKSSASFDEQILPEPFKLEGFFRAGIKGKQITRPLSESEQRFKNGVLQGDALQIFQSGHYNYHSNPQEQEKKLPGNGIDSQTRREIARFFKDSSESSSYDVDGSCSIEKVVQCSPVLGGIKNFKKKTNLIKSDVDTALKDISDKNNQSSKNKQIPREEKCKRRLFVNDNANLDREYTEYSTNNNNNTGAVRFSPGKPSPENVIYFTEHFPLKSMDNKLNENQHEINPLDPLLIKSYITNCKIIAKRELRGIFSDTVKDPMETAKAALKTIYMKTFKDDIQRHKESKQGSYSAGKTTSSSGSEIMLEPDSAIARTLKKNSEIQLKSVSWFSENNSDSSNNDLDNSKTGFPLDQATVENNQMKRKRAPSSKGDYSESEFPSSIKVNVDPKSVRIGTRMDSIQPERQELVARYLKDVNTNSKRDNKESVLNDKKHNTKEYHNNIFQKEKLFVSDNPQRTFFIHKSTKHIPAILRKNRSLADCVAKEKIRLTIEKCQKPDEIVNKTSVEDSACDSNLLSEHTPNYGSTMANQLIEAPKCKYTYMNAKYNQPSRIHIPQVQNNNRFQRNSIPERHLFPSPNNKKDFVIPQNFEPSPIKELNFSKPNCDLHRHHQLSQESSEQNSNCMTRMVSFGEIQERTDRLTLRSSQGQHCSQDSVGQLFSSPEECYNAQPDFYYQQYESSNNCIAHSNLPITFNEIPVTQSFNAALNSNYNYHSHDTMKHKEDSLYISKNEYPIMSTKEYSPQRSKEFNCCLSHDYQVYRNPNLQQNKEPIMSCIPVQQSNVRQPVKYIAIEGDRIAQRRPIYSANDSNSCSHPHKKSISAQQFTQVLNPCYPRDVPNQPCYAISSMPSMVFPAQNASQPLLVSDYEIGNIHKVNNVVPNVQRSCNLSSEVSGLNRGALNFVSSNASDQSFIAQRVPVQTAVNNHRYIGQQMQMRVPSSMYSQVGYEHNHCSNNEGQNINGVYLQKMNRNIHFQMP